MDKRIKEPEHAKNDGSCKGGEGHRWHTPAGWENM
jgi:hypothetical protein